MLNVSMSISHLFAGNCGLRSGNTAAIDLTRITLLIPNSKNNCAASSRIKPAEAVADHSLFVVSRALSNRRGTPPKNFVDETELFDRFMGEHKGIQIGQPHAAI